MNDFHLGARNTSTADAPLANAHVLITRPVMPASRTATRLAALGATPYVFPTIIVEPPLDSAPLRNTLANLARYHAAFFVSPSAAEMTLAPLGAATITLPSALQVYAPGPGTAEELHIRGVTHVEIPEHRFDSEGLLALASLQAPQVKGKRMVIFRGDDGREHLREVLEQRGATVDAITAYRRRAPTSPPTGLVELLQSKKLTAISAMSSDAVMNLVTIVPPQERALLFSLPLYASHVRIADTATQCGFQHVIKTEAGDPGLIATLLKQSQSQ